MANLLIVDDELSMRQFLTHLFQRDGHAVRVAENGRKAMDMVRQQPADVIISDVKMPDMGGIELLRAAREFNPHVEVIMMTAFANDDLRERIGPAAADADFLPFADAAERVRESVRAVENSPVLPDSFRASGFVFDVETGRIDAV